MNRIIDFLSSNRLSLYGLMIVCSSIIVGFFADKYLNNNEKSSKKYKNNEEDEINNIF